MARCTSKWGAMRPSSTGARAAQTKPGGTLEFASKASTKCSELHHFQLRNSEATCYLHRQWAEKAGVLCSAEEKQECRVGTIQPRKYTIIKLTAHRPACRSVLEAERARDRAQAKPLAVTDGHKRIV